MNTDSYTKMVEDGRNIINVLNSVPKDKRFLASMMAEVYLNGLTTGVSPSRFNGHKKAKKR